MQTIFVFSVITLLIVPCHSDENNKIRLNFSYITTITGAFRASGGIPLVDLALEEINNHPDVLENYTLSYTTILDSNCNRSASLDAFFQHFDNDSEPTYISTVCCGCSVATIPVAEISHYWNIPQIAFAAAAFELTNRQQYRNFFRILPSFQFNAASIAGVVRYFGWRQMAVITQNEAVFTGVTDTIRTIFNDEGWVLDDSALIETNANPFPYDVAFSWIRNREYRVIFINTYQVYTYEILCEAFNRGMLSPQYVWITIGSFSKGWFRGLSSCSESSISQIIEGSLAIVPDGYFAVESSISYSGLNSSEFLERYNMQLADPRYDAFPGIVAPGIVYDTIWTLALGLQRAAEKVAQGNESGCEGLIGDLVPLEEFDYKNQKMGCIFRRSLAETKFTGITGPILFNSNGSRSDNVILLQQYRLSDSDDNDRRTVAEVEIGLNGSTFTFREGESEYSLWESGTPYDGFPDEVIHSTSTPLFVIYTLLSSIGIVFVIGCLLFNIIFRNKKIVKLASPNLNYFVILGAAILYICAFLYVFSTSTQTSATILCNFQVWFFSLGYTLCFAVILSKTWRVYCIFDNPNLKKKAIKDWMLLLMVGIVVTIDIAIVLIGTAIPQSRLEAARIRDREHQSSISDDGITEDNYIFVCTMNDSVIWLGISFAYKGLLQIVAIFLAFHIRKVKIKALNDAKEIAAIIYINSIILVIMAVSLFVLDTYHNTHAALFGLALLLQASCFLGIIFIPKMVKLYYDPEGLRVFSDTSAMPSSMKSETESGTNTDQTELISNLKKRIQELEAKLAVSKPTEADP